MLREKNKNKKTVNPKNSIPGTHTHKKKNPSVMKAN